MLSQSWYLLVTAPGLLLEGLSFACKDAINQTFADTFHLKNINIGIFLSIAGGVVVFLGAYLWALEGPGGYYLHPKGEGVSGGKDGSVRLPYPESYDRLAAAGLLASLPLFAG